MDLLIAFVVFLACLWMVCAARQRVHMDEDANYPPMVVNFAGGDFSDSTRRKMKQVILGEIRFSPDNKCNDQTTSKALKGFTLVFQLYCEQCGLKDFVKISNYLDFDGLCQLI